MDQNSQNIVLINNSRTYLNFNTIYEFLGQFSIRLRYIYHLQKKKKSVDNFEIEHKTYSFWVRGAVPH